MIAVSLNALPLPALLVQADGTVVETNHRLQEIMGRADSCEHSPSFHQCLTESASEYWTAHFSHAGRGDLPSPAEVQFKNQDQTFRFCFEFAEEHSPGTLFLGIICQVCQAVANEKRLHESEQRLKLAMEASGIGLWDHDLIQDKVQRTGQWSEMLGYEPHEIDENAASWKAIIHPEDMALVEKLAQLHESGSSRVFKVEHRLKTKRGDYKWILNWGRVVERDAAGKALRAVGAHIDIDSRKRAEISLREQKTMLSEAEDMALMGSFDWDLRARIPQVSPGFCRLLRLPRNATKQQILNAVHPEDRADILAVINEMLNQNSGEAEAEFRVLLSEWQVRHFVGRCVVLRDGEGRSSHLVGVIQDITRQRESEEALRALVKEKEWLIKEMHHRVKNNFQIISSLISLQMQSLTDEQVLSTLRMSQTRVQSMAILHHKLYSAKNISNVLMSDYIRDLTVELYKLHGADPARVSLVTDLESVELGLDEAVPLGLVVNELFSNAIKYAFREMQGKRGEIRIGLRELSTSQFELTLSDNGKGFDWQEDLQESLGLRLVRILVEDQLAGKLIFKNSGGASYTISFASRPGRGTPFS